jgi:hypothetical protein
MNDYKVLVLIINYGTNQSEFCLSLIKELKNIKNYLLDIKIFSSTEQVFDECENFYIQNYEGYNFSNSIYDYLKKSNLSNYTHVLMTENDILFTQKNFDYYFEYEKKKLSEDLTFGFLRYEIKENQKFLIDCGHNEDKICFKSNEGIVEILENKLFRTKNCHQGCWMFSVKNLQKIIHIILPGLSLEDKISNYFYSEIWPGTSLGIKKFTPFCDFENFLIHHQSNKYINIYDDLPSVSELINQRNEYIICN